MKTTEDIVSLNPPAAEPRPRPPLRLWPGVALVALIGVFRFGVPLVFPEAMAVAFMGAVVGGLAVFGWWLFFSRAPWLERIGAVLLAVVALLATKGMVHPSIAGGMMGLMLYFCAIPVLSLALVASVVTTRQLSTRVRRGAMAVAILLGSGIFTLLRTGGINSAADSDLHWRWSQTPEERLLAQAAEEPKVTPQPIPAAAKSAAAWPGFRGPNRDSVIRGVRIETNWTASPPAELWRREIGPAWSSFAVSGDLLYTQEQRGDDEVVACYNVANGEPAWRHQDAARFYESNAGPGPRGTPTVKDGRVYSFGATGIVNALDALTGAVVWSRNAGADTKKEPPGWGFASSPLVVGDVVIVAVTGTLIAYDLATGAPRWTGPADGKSYSSPHLTEIDGVPQIVLISGVGATSIAPADGKTLWQHAWPGMGVTQPAQIANGEFVISTGDRIGARRIQIGRTDNGWTVAERWTSNRLKAYFNDYVLHRGHAYGFDGGILTCVDLEEGGRKWKGGRYGSGQVLLLADQDVLLVLSEQGDLALVAAKPEEFTELARFPAIEGKTWNHPVLAGDLLLVRNDREMAAFRLALK